MCQLCDWVKSYVIFNSVYIQNIQNIANLGVL